VILEFIELPAFTRRLREYELTDDWLADLQSDLIEGRGRLYRPRQLAGFHKKRVPHPGRGKGKRGGLRVYYMPYEDLGIVVLALLTDKDIEANISTQEQERLRATAATLRTEVENYGARKHRE
jgi:hypothetical protein